MVKWHLRQVSTILHVLLFFDFIGPALLILIKSGFIFKIFRTHDSKKFIHSLVFQHPSLNFGGWRFRRQRVEKNLSSGSSSHTHFVSFPNKKSAEIQKHVTKSKVEKIEGFFAEKKYLKYIRDFEELKISSPAGPNLWQVRALKLD